MNTAENWHESRMSQRFERIKNPEFAMLCWRTFFPTVQLTLTLFTIGNNFDKKQK